MPWNPDGPRLIVDIFWHTFTFHFSRSQHLRGGDFVSLLSHKEEKIICARDDELCIMLGDLTASFVKEKPNELEIHLSSRRLIERR